MPNTFNANATVQALSDAVAMDSKLKGEMYSRVLEEASVQHNAFEQFSSSMNPKSGMHGGVRSIFAKKTDLAAGGSSVVNFNVIGTPGGPGVMGNQELTGNTSKSIMATYGVRVGWHRDGFELDREQVEFLSAGRSLVQTTVDLLAQKMGILRQNLMMMRLIKSASGNIYRAGNRGSTDALLHTDTLALSVAHSSRSRLRTLGGKPISHKLSGSGSPIDGYLIMATDQALLPIRNDSSFSTVTAASAAAHGDTRGSSNANFTGELLNWGGMPWYEFPIIDESWDDYIGNPMLAKAKITKYFDSGSAAWASPQGSDSGYHLIASPSSVTSFTTGTPRYFQFFNGYDYRFVQSTDDEAAVTDSGEYYAWIVNPNGDCAFVSYTGSDNIGTRIKIKNILAPASGTNLGSPTAYSSGAVNTTSLDATTVGNLILGNTATIDGTNTATEKLRVIKNTGTGGNITVPSGVNLTDRVDVGAIVLQANKNGNVIGRGFVFGSMAACYANGRIAMNPIEQTRDFGFTIGRGFETILGAGVTKNPNKVPAGYLVLEHVVEHEGYPTPYVA